MKCGCHVIAAWADIGIRHDAGFSRDSGQGQRRVIGTIVADALYGNCRIVHAPGCLLHRFDTGFTRFSLVYLGNTASKRTLQITESVAAYAFDFELCLNRVGE